VNLTQFRGEYTIIETMVTRRFFAFAVLATLFVAPCSGICTGWSASSDARMACCAGKSADEAMACCASSESRQNADSSASATPSLPALEPLILEIASTLAPELRAASAIASHEPLTADSERHVLLSVFLI
jgi:hypothetical protein